MKFWFHIIVMVTKCVTHYLVWCTTFICLFVVDYFSLSGSCIFVYLFFCTLVLDFFPLLRSCVWDKFQSSGAIVDLADCDGESSKYITWDRGQHHVPSLFSFFFFSFNSQIYYLQIYSRMIYTKYIYYIPNTPPGTEVNTMCLPF